MNAINKAVQAVNDAIEASIDLGDRGRYQCIAELVEKDGKILPIIKRNNQSDNCLPNGNFLLNIYHRVMEGPDIETIDGFGDETLENITLRMRLYGYVKPEVFGSDTFTTRDMAMRVMDAMGGKIEVDGDGIRWLWVTKVGNIETDGQVWGTEYPSADQGRGNPLRVPAFSFEYQISGQLCAGFCLA